MRSRFRRNWGWLLAPLVIALLVFAELTDDNRSVQERWDSFTPTPTATTPLWREEMRATQTARLISESAFWRPECKLAANMRLKRDRTIITYDQYQGWEESRHRELGVSPDTYRRQTRDCF